MLAAQNGHAAEVQLLLAAEGIGVNQVGPRDGVFSLLMAAFKDHVSLVKLLLAGGRAAQ